MLLAIDTSSRWMGVAVYDGTTVLSEVVWHAPDYHTSQLAAMAEQVLERAGLTPVDLKAVAVALGPGGYTGLRVGLAFAKGLVFAAHLGVVGVPSLDALVAAQIPAYLGGAQFSPGLQNILFAAVLQAGRGRFAVGWYRVQKNLAFINEGYEIAALDVLSERMRARLENGDTAYLCGELTPRDRQVISQNAKTAPEYPLVLAGAVHSLRRPAYLAELAWARWQAGNADDPATLAPIYLQ